MLVAFILEILPRQTAQNSCLRRKWPTAAERTQDKPATAETTELAETPVHVEHSEVMLFVSSQRILQICRCKAEASNRSSKTSERNKKAHLAQLERRHKQHPKCKVFRRVSEGSPATNGPDIQWKRNLSLLTRELRYKLRG